MKPKRGTLGHVPPHRTRSEKTEMSNQTHIVGNGVGHAPCCPTPAAWPPPWLVSPAAESSSPAPASPAVASEPAGPATPPKSTSGPAEGDGDGWDSAIEPAPACPRCGSLELWWDVWGGQHCQHCQAEGHRWSQQLAERAARLRKIARQTGRPQTRRRLRALGDQKKTGAIPL